MALTKVFNRMIASSPTNAADFGAVSDGSDNTSEIQLSMNFVDVSVGGNWYDKGKELNVNGGSRITLGSYQSGVTGIIPFADLDWPLNANVHFFGGSHEPATHINNIADDGTPVNEKVIMAPYHPGIAFDYKSPSSYTPYTQPAHIGSASQSFCSIVARKDGVNVTQLYTDTDNGEFALKCFKPSSPSTELSKCYHVDCETGDMGIQVSTHDTVDNSALMVGGSAKIRSGAVAINGHESDVEPRLYLHDGTSGQRSYIGIDATSKGFKMTAISSLSGENDLLNVNSKFILTQDGLVKSSAEGAITAYAGGGQVNATALTKKVNQIGTVASAGDSVKLPSAVSGFSLEITIINTGSNACDVFPSSGDSIGAGIDTAVSLAAGSNITYISYNATNWVAKT